MVRFAQWVAAIVLLSKAAAFPQSPPGVASTPEPAVTFHVSTRMVTLEVVARDGKGRPATGLTTKDFQIFENSPGHKKQEQKVASFRSLGIAELSGQRPEPIKVPPGVFTNQVSTSNSSVPPTILLVDGLNTDIVNQIQVHRQMVKMLNALPSDVPVAVFLLGYQLRMLQNFTTDPALLKAALQKASSSDGSDLGRIDPRDDPNSGSAFLEDVPNVPATFLRSIQRFEQETYASNMDVRVRTTAEALVSIARHVTGYPGRKNLLWISSSFPVILGADTDEFAGFRNYESQMQQVASALGDAKVAVYPIDPAGLQPGALFDSSMKRRREIAFEPTDALQRESQIRVDERSTMNLLATQTGGKVCVDNNDLGECVQKAVNDSSAFYEIAYYPENANWNGEFRHITVKTTSPGLRLAYREGYFATSDDKSKSKNEEQHLQQAACDDYLTSTSILLAAKVLSREAADKITYSLVIAPSMLSFVPVEDGKRELKFTLASCAFDKAGKALQLVVKPIDIKFTDKQYQAVIAARGLPTTVAVPAKDDLAWVRLVIKDVATGHLGSVNVPVAPATAAATTANTSPQH